MIWDKTTHLGMALASDGKSTFVVARYWPAGNVVGERPVEAPVRGDGEFGSAEPASSLWQNTRHPCV